MIDLDTERMRGRGDAVRDGMKANKLYGLNDMCVKYIDKSTELLELGCNECVSTRLFCYYAGKVTGIDRYKSPQVDIVKGEFPLFQFINESFHSYLSKCNRMFDIVYIDGDHMYNSVMSDIHNCLSVIKPGGIISGHDYYTTTNSGVPQAVSDKLGDFGDPEVFSDSSWLIKLKV